MANAKIYKMEMYITDYNDHYNIKRLINDMNNTYDVLITPFNIKEKDIDWQDDININQKHTTQEDYEMYFKTPNLVHAAREEKRINESLLEEHMITKLDDSIKRSYTIKAKPGYDDKKIEYLFRLLQEVKEIDDKFYIDRKGLAELILKEIVKELNING